MMEYGKQAQRTKMKCHLIPILLRKTLAGVSIYVLVISRVCAYLHFASPKISLEFHIFTKYLNESGLERHTYDLYVHIAL